MIIDSFTLETIKDLLPKDEEDCYQIPYQSSRLLPLYHFILLNPLSFPLGQP